MSCNCHFGKDEFQLMGRLNKAVVDSFDKLEVPSGQTWMVSLLTS